MAVRALRIQAGSEAYALLRERGFDRELFSTLIGASGGPKWLVLAGIDRVLAERVVAGRSRPLHLLGSSIGAYRHACMVQRDPLAAIERLERLYIGQRYGPGTTPRDVAEESRRILEGVLGDTGSAELLRNELLHTHVVAVRCRWAVASERRWPLALGLAAAALANAVARPALGAFFERALFTTSPQHLRFRGFLTRVVALEEANVVDAIVASGSIPLVMTGVRDLPGAPPGIYRDGGIIDYHFDFSFEAPPGLILYPHFFDDLTPGWFDKRLRRRVPAARMKRVVLLLPTAEFVESLPHEKIPDRDDFRRFSNDERQNYWRRVARASERLGDELAELLGGGGFAGRMEQLS